MATKISLKVRNTEPPPLIKEIFLKKHSFNASQRKNHQNQWGMFVEALDINWQI